MWAAALAKEPSVFLPGCVHLKGPRRQGLLLAGRGPTGSLASLPSSSLHEHTPGRTGHRLVRGDPVADCTLHSTAPFLSPWPSWGREYQAQTQIAPAAGCGSASPSPSWGPTDAGAKAAGVGVTVQPCTWNKPRLHPGKPIPSSSSPRPSIPHHLQMSPALSPPLTLQGPALVPATPALRHCPTCCPPSSASTVPSGAGSLSSSYLVFGSGRLLSLR